MYARCFAYSCVHCKAASSVDNCYLDCVLPLCCIKWQLKLLFDFILSPVRVATGVCVLPLVLFAVRSSGGSMHKSSAQKANPCTAVRSQDSGCHQPDGLLRDVNPCPSTGHFVWSLRPKATTIQGTQGQMGLSKGHRSSWTTASTHEDLYRMEQSVWWSGPLGSEGVYNPF